MVPTFPGQEIEEILDQLAIQVFFLYLDQNGFAFQAVAVDNFLDIFGPPGAILQFQSFDPGLDWFLPDCEHPGWQHAELLPGDEVRLSWSENNPSAMEYDVIITPLGGEPPINLNSVVGGATVNLSWDPVPNTVGCQLSATQVAPPGPTGTVNVLGIEVANTTVGTGFLGAGTTWDWQVRCA
ncbi:MAG: hypothetical protein ACI959_000842 [Limisphaerales bacterium]|jgi:hypothetical protein